MAMAHDILLRKLQEHSEFGGADIAAIRALPHTERRFGAGQDIVRQGDKPAAAVLVLQGAVGRYHTLPMGRRQYLSIHIVGDLPDAQSLFIETMDHSVCALDESLISSIPHVSLLRLFKEHPAAGIAIWRETLIDAAIFRQAITNNSGRPLEVRLAHFFCEQYYRARAVGRAKLGSCRLPLTQTQIGETVGASLPSIARALRTLRRTGAMGLQGGELHIRDWKRMTELGDFNPGYLHLRRPSRL